MHSRHSAALPAPASLIAVGHPIDPRAGCEASPRQRAGERRACRAWPAASVACARGEPGGVPERDEICSAMDGGPAKLTRGLAVASELVDQARRGRVTERGRRTGQGPRSSPSKHVVVDSRSAPSRGQLTGRSRRHQRRSPRRDASDRRGQVLAGRSGRRREPPGWRRRRGRRAVQPVGYGHTGQATTTLGGPHHATRPTMRSSAVMGLGR